MYVGSTKDLQRRFQEHNEGKVFSTKRYMPWRLVYYEAYATEKLARERELKLKHHGSAFHELRKRLGFTQPQRRGAGFTIPELLVSLFIFSLVIVGAGGLLVSGMGVQRRSGAQQELMDQASYLAEYMSRALRQARKDADAACLSRSGRNYEVSSNGTDWIADGSGDRIRFINKNGQCQTFFLEAQRLKERIALDEQYLTSNNLQATRLGFYISGAGQEDNLQPKATFAVELKGGVQQGGSQPTLNIQTTVSQRKIDVPE